MLRRAGERLTMASRKILVSLDDATVAALDRIEAHLVETTHEPSSRSAAIRHAARVAVAALDALPSRAAGARPRRRATSDR